jgi:hypothetical protein
LGGRKEGRKEGREEGGEESGRRVVVGLDRQREQRFQEFGSNKGKAL